MDLLLIAIEIEYVPHCIVPYFVHWEMINPGSALLKIIKTSWCSTALTTNAARDLASRGRVVAVYASILNVASSLYVDGVSWRRAARMFYASGYMSIPKHSAKIPDIYANKIRPVITLWYCLNPNRTLSHLAH
eukprot:scaffold385_cov38-Cyclotella_meneghiniana.AAC.5